MLTEKIGITSHSFYNVEKPEDCKLILWFNHDSFHYIGHPAEKWDMESYGSRLVAIFKIKYK